jgi:hypothetical protein
MGRGCAAVPPAVHAGNYRVSHAAVLAGWNSSAVLPRQLRSPSRSQQIGHTRNDGADLHYGAVAHLSSLLPGARVLLLGSQRALHRLDALYREVRVSDEQC